MSLLLLKALRTRGLFQRAIIVNREEGVKLIATVFHYKYGVNIKETIGAP